VLGGLEGGVPVAAEPAPLPRESVRPPPDVTAPTPTVLPPIRGTGQDRALPSLQQDNPPPRPAAAAATAAATAAPTSGPTGGATAAAASPVQLSQPLLSPQARAQQNWQEGARAATDSKVCVFCCLPTVKTPLLSTDREEMLFMCFAPKCVVFAWHAAHSRYPAAQLAAAPLDHCA
jgi:hypothetical protein